MISLSGPRVLDGERVDAEAEERVADHLRQVLVGEERPDREDRLVVRAGVGEDVEVAVPRVLAEPLRDLPEVQPAELGVLRSRLEVHALPLALVDEAPVAVALVAHPLAERRVAQLRRRGLRPVLGHPRRQDPGHLAEALAERASCRRGRRAPSRGSPPSSRPRAPSPARARSCCGGRSGARSRPSCSPPGRPRGTRRSPRAGPSRGCGCGSCRCRRTRPATAFRRISSSVVASRPGLNSSPVDIPSAPDCIASWTKPSIVVICSALGVEPGHARREPDRVVADEPGEVRRVADVREELEVLAEGRPRDRRLVEPERVQPAADRRLGCGRDGRVAPAAVADDLGRDALADRALGGRVREDREVAVAVRVDEPGADDLAGRVDDAVRGRGRAEPADVGDLAALDRDVAEVRRAAGAVGDPAVHGSGRRARRYFLARNVADVRAEPGIEDVAQPVAEEVEAQHDDHDRGAREDRQPRRGCRCTFAPVLSMLPHDASGGCVPSPRKLSAASARIATDR